MDWAALGTVLTRLRFEWALAGWALSFLIIFGMTLRWRIFLGQQNIPLSFSTVLSLIWAGQFFNSVLPGSTGGDVVKIYQACRLAPDQKPAAAATVFVDRLTALVALVVLTSISLAINPAPLGILSSVPLSPRLVFAWVSVALAGALILAWVVLRLVRSSVWAGRISRTFAAVRKNLSFNRRFLVAILLAFAIHLVSFSTAYLFARALRIPISYPQVLLMMPVVLFVVLLPVTINGHGLRELLLIGYFSQMGIIFAGQSETGAREMAIALSLLLVTNDLLWSIPGGIWYFQRFKGNSGPKPSQSASGDDNV